MAAGKQSPPQPNGLRGAFSQDEEKFYETLFRLRDDVFAGRHPHYKLPDHVRPSVQIASPPGRITATAPLRPQVDEQLISLSNGLSNGMVDTDNVGQSVTVHGRLRRPSQLSGRSKPLMQLTPAAQRQDGSKNSTAKPLASGIDPILLSKSDHLVKAEIQLKRQRIERALRDQIDSRKHTRERDSRLEHSSLLDLTSILTDAWKRVKPVSGLQATLADTHSSESEPFDNYSTYTNQASDIPPLNQKSKGEAKKDQAKAVPLEVDTTKASAALNIDLQPPKMDTHETTRAGLVLARTKPLEHTVAEEPHIPDNVMVASDPAADLGTEAEQRDESYSPPTADAFGGVTGDYSLGGDTRALPTARSENDRTAERREMSLQIPARIDTGQRGPPLHDFPIVTNHISSPLAPQPSRVSPLATALAPKPGARAIVSPRQPISRRSSLRLEPTQFTAQARPVDCGPRSPRQPHQESPPRAGQGMIRSSRKRIREEASSKNSPELSSRKRVARSPELLIKAEPTSPLAPLNSFQDYYGARIAPREYEYVEIRTPVKSGPSRVREGVQVEGPYAYNGNAFEIPEVVRVLSSSAYKRTDWNEHDLRRVASFQYERRPQSPCAPYISHAPIENRRAQGPSASYMEPPLSHPRYVEEQRRPIPPFYFQRSRSPSEFGEQIAHRVRSAPIAVARPSRYVIDQYGNRYYPAPLQSELEPMTIPLAKHYDMESYYERPQSRQPRAQGLIRLVDRFERRPQVQMRPPPPPGLDDHSDVEFIESRPLRQSDHEPPRREPILLEDHRASRRGSMNLAAPSRHGHTTYPTVNKEHAISLEWARGEYRETELLNSQYDLSTSYIPDPDPVRREGDFAKPADGAESALRTVSVNCGAEYPSPDDRRYSLNQHPQERHSFYDQIDEPQPGHVEAFQLEQSRRRTSYRY